MHAPDLLRRRPLLRLLPGSRPSRRRRRPCGGGPPRPCAAAQLGPASGRRRGRRPGGCQAVLGDRAWGRALDVERRAVQRLSPSGWRLRFSGGIGLSALPPRPAAGSGAGRSDRTGLRSGRGRGADRLLPARVLLRTGRWRSVGRRFSRRIAGLEPAPRAGLDSRSCGRQPCGPPPAALLPAALCGPRRSRLVPAAVQEVRRRGGAGVSGAAWICEIGARVAAGDSGAPPAGRVVVGRPRRLRRLAVRGAPQRQAAGVWLPSPG